MMTPQIKAVTWQPTVNLLAMLAFSAFALWLTASHWDKSELRSMMLLTVGFVVREFLPKASALLKMMGDSFGNGGQVE
jgi:uncharacterized membrane protein